MELNISHIVTDNLTETFLSNTSGITLQDLNDEETRRRIVPLVYLGLLSVFGIPGNALIMYVYILKFQKKAVHRTFVIALALTDLLVCGLAVPFEISQMTREYTFTSAWLCKFGRTMKSFLTIASAFILIALSVNRYHRICHPLRRQLNCKEAIRLIMFIVAFAFILALPEVALTGIMLHKLENNLIGHDCSGCHNFAQTVYPMIYSTGKLVIFSLSMVILLIMCVLIGRQIVIHEKFRDQFRIPNTQATLDTAACIAGLTGIDLEKQKLSHINNYQTKMFNNSDHRHNLLYKESQGKIPLKGKGTKSNISRSKLNAPMKVTKTALVVSICFIVLFLPFAIIKVVDAVKEGYIMPPSPLASIILPTFSRSQLMNNVVNVFVYLGMDVAFRRHSKEMFVSLFSLFKKRL